MCGRYARSKDQATLVEEFAITSAPSAELPADYNVAPTKQVYVVLARPDPAGPGNPVRALEVARWGLVPSWAKDPSIGSRLINARVETAAEKPAFRRAFAKRRCLVPADGFYEWYSATEPGAPVGRGGKPVKQPFLIRPTDGRSLALAGLYEFWPSPAGEWLLSMTVLTTTATDALGHIHDRMPFDVAPQSWEQWLDPQVPAPRAAALLEAHRAAELQAYPVATDVNNVRNNGPQLMVPLPLG
jgi:putative SOS response-associated peptidase YedK